MAHVFEISTANSLVVTLAPISHLDLIKSTYFFVSFRTNQDAFQYSILFLLLFL
jgi:hypothetical protein